MVEKPAGKHDVRAMLLHRGLMSRHYLNQAMIEMLRKDCAATDEKIKTDPFARWTEEHKIFTSTLADTVTQLASAAVMYRAMQAKPVEGPVENPLGKFKDKFAKGGTEDIPFKPPEITVNSKGELTDYINVYRPKQVIFMVVQEIDKE